MRKIITKQDRDRKNKINQILIGAVLIVIMVFGTLGGAMLFKNNEESSEEIVYKGIEFVQEDSGYWKFNIQGYEFLTKYNPTETEDIYFFVYGFINDYANKPLYFVSEYNEPNFELSRNLNSFASRFNEACLPESNCSDDSPVKNCSADNVIIIKEPEEENSRIYQEENCVYIIAEFSNQTRYADAFLFKILGL